MVDEIIGDAEKRMKHAVEAMVHDFSTYRTGRANPVVLDRVHVEYYGSQSPITHVANVSVPDPQTLAITPYDKGSLHAIEKALQKSDLGINPTNDGTVIRLVFPKMTEDRRKELVKQVHQRTEHACVAIRNVRRDAMEHLKAAMKHKEVGEDDEKALEGRVQKLTDKFIEEAHKLQQKKDAELMEV